jgi:hypothetical protein
VPAHPYELPLATAPDVFISYARRDYDKVRRITDQFAALDVSFWLDHQAIDGSENFAAAIARGIKLCRIFVLMCSDAALHSRNVSKEIILAWKYSRPYLPLMLERVSFPEQIEYFLEGVQWIEILDQPAPEWVPRLQRALAIGGVASRRSTQPAELTSLRPASALSTVPHSEDRADLASLRALARFNDCIWPIAADGIRRHQQPRATFRGLGAPQKNAQRTHKIGSRLALVIYAERDGNLLLIDEGHDGIIYCLSPSWFAPDTQISRGLNYLPQTNALYDAFEVSGVPGREHLLAIITDERLELDWMPPDPRSPARVLNTQDVALLLTQLQQRDPASWVAFATYFDVVR